MEIAVRPLQESDLAEADRIFRVAFGTFIGIPDPASFMGDADLVKGRYRANPSAALGAYFDGNLVGSNFLANWGSFGFFGPLTVRPDLWDKGVAKSLMNATMDLFAKWGTRLEGLFTFPHSAKHIALYQKYGFWPQYLTAVMAKEVTPKNDAKFRVASKSDVDACRKLTDSIFPGLDVSREIEAVAQQRLGETILLDDGAFAICHTGGGTEAGSGAAYVKFGAARDARAFGRLLDAVESFAHSRGAQRLMAGVNTARHEAYQAMLDRRFRSMLIGVAMQRPNESGYNRPGCFVIDDWR